MTREPFFGNLQRGRTRRTPVIIRDDDEMKIPHSKGASGQLRLKILWDFMDNGPSETQDRVTTAGVCVFLSAFEGGRGNTLETRSTPYLSRATPKLRIWRGREREKMVVGAHAEMRPSRNASEAQEHLCPRSGAELRSERARHSLFRPPC